MKRIFHVWDNGDSSVGMPGSSYKVSFEIEDFDETIFDADNINYLHEEIDNMVIQFLRKNEEFFSEFRANIMTDYEYKKMCDDEYELERQFDESMKEA